MTLSTTADFSARLYAALRGNARPVFVFGDSIISAANLWSGARVWVRAFRAAGLEPGSRVLLALAPSQNFLWPLIAALCEGLSLAIGPEPAHPDDLAALEDELDVALSIAAVSGKSTQSSAPPHRVLCANAYDLPPLDQMRARRPRLPNSPEAQLLLRSSGTASGRGTWVALSAANILSVVDSHRAGTGFDQATVLSVLPWHHAFGCVLELLPALLCQAEVVRDLAGGRDPERLVQLLDAWDFIRLSGVPVLFERLFAVGDRGGAAFGQLEGIVGGAPVSAELAAELAQTRLQAGYGQTQAGPGIALGAPGDWAPGYLGEAVGCQVTLADDGELLYRGANMSPGDWNQTTGLQSPALRDGYRASGDIVRQSGSRLFFEARKDFAVKLPNGRWLHPQTIEAGLRQQHAIAGHCLVISNPGSGRLCVVCSDPAAQALLGDRLAAGVLGTPVDAFIAAVKFVPAAELPLMPKGDVRRDRLQQQIFRLHDE